MGYYSADNKFVMEKDVRIRIWFFVVLAAVLPACVTPGQDGSSSSADATAPPSYLPQADLSNKERFREVLTLLEKGKPEQARMELVLYLENQPNSEIGSDLLQQIDLPPQQYFPEEYTQVMLDSGVSLSGLAKLYLGSVYKFHALAKYNGLLKPSDLTAGQAIKIPLTPEAVAVFAGGVPHMAPGEPVDAVEAPATVETEMEMPIEESALEAREPTVDPAAALAAEVETLHREALNAYRAQKLDAAIELWDQVLGLDPDYESARLYRSQAIELKKKLSNFN
jgi:tetratricopeptide (TPR) repeat protein